MGAGTHIMSRSLVVPWVCGQHSCALGLLSAHVVSAKRNLEGHQVKTEEPRAYVGESWQQKGCMTRSSYYTEAEHPHRYHTDSSLAQSH